jgi:hypothetical protein
VQKGSFKNFELKEEALAESGRVKIMYGIAVNGGLKFPVTSDAGVEEFLARM